MVRQPDMVPLIVGVLLIVLLQGYAAPDSGVDHQLRPHVITLYPGAWR